MEFLQVCKGYKNKIEIFKEKHKKENQRKLKIPLVFRLWVVLFLYSVCCRENSFICFGFCFAGLQTDPTILCSYSLLFLLDGIHLHKKRFIAFPLSQIYIFGKKTDSNLSSSKTNFASQRSSLYKCCHGKSREKSEIPKNWATKNNMR